MARAARTETLSRGPEEGDGVEDASAAAYLFVVFDGQDIAAPPVRLALSGVDEIALGRAEARGFAQVGRRLDVRLADRWMSSTHARIFQAFGGWVIEDSGSKNGTLVGGRAVDRAELTDGDVIEVGHTFLLFRRSLPYQPGAPAVLDAAASRRDAPGLFTLSPALERSFARLAAMAGAAVPVILEGETGTGKEVVARAVHALSGRRGDFVAVNCGALPAALVEGQLFGHRRGAFSGATEDQQGLVRAAHQGTLLLDEIGELAAPAQAALLRVLEQREVLPIGATRPIPVDVRVISATHRSLDRMVEEGSFRRDLHARLAGFRIELPPLRDRREDLGLLAAALLARGPRPAPSVIEPRAARALIRFGWPGNVRQLEKCLSAAAVLAGSGPIALDHLPDEVRGASPAAEGARPPGAPDERRAAQRDQLVLLLREHQGNISAVARAMGKARMQVQRWLKQYGLDPEAFRG